MYKTRLTSYRQLAMRGNKYKGKYKGKYNFKHQEQQGDYYEVNIKAGSKT